MDEHPNLKDFAEYREWLKDKKEVPCCKRARLEGFNEAKEMAAKILQDSADRQDKSWTEYLASGKEGPATCFANIPRGYAEQVRAMQPEVKG